MHQGMLLVNTAMRVVSSTALVLQQEEGIVLAGICQYHCRAFFLTFSLLAGFLLQALRFAFSGAWPILLQVASCCKLAAEGLRSSCRLLPCLGR